MPPTTPSHTDLPAALLLLAAVLVAYANAMHGPFQFDDYNVIVNNEAAHGFSAWSQEMPGIRPLLKLSYVASWATELGAVGFHTLNIALHFFNALLVFCISRRLLALLQSPHAAVFVTAMITALIFTLHPAQTEAVTYISGRSVSLMATFTLASLLAWLKMEDSEHPTAWRMASALLFAAALATKENAWVLPLALLLCDMIRHDFSWRTFLRKSAAHWLILTGLVLAVFSVSSYWHLLIGSLKERPLAENLLAQIDGIFYLITQPLLTLTLNIDPHFTVTKAVTWPLAIKALVLAGILASAIVCWRKSRNLHWISFGILWFFLWLLPTNSILPRTDVANDRQLYLALIGPALIIGVLLGKLPVWHRTTLTAALLLVLGISTTLRNEDYRSEVALWEATATRSASKARVWNNLGYARQEAGDFAGAKAAWQQALVLDANQWRAKNNLQMLEFR